MNDILLTRDIELMFEGYYTTDVESIDCHLTYVLRSAYCQMTLA